MATPYITPTKAFAHLQRLADWQEGRTPAPVTVEWDLTNVCSLACQSCHMAYTHTAGPWAVQDVAKPASYTDTGRLADVAVVSRGIVEMASAGVKGIVWSGGGEPTLHPEFSPIVSHTAYHGLLQGLYTLGGHITNDIEAVARNLSWVVVSLDAPDAMTYAAEKGVPPSRFADACKGISTLAGLNGPVVGVSFLLHQHNYTRTREMVSLSRKLGATYTTFRPAIEASASAPCVVTADRAWVTDALPDLEALARYVDVEVNPSRFVAYRDWKGHGYRTCHGVKLVTTVTPDGRVWICPNRRGVTPLGDLRTESFADIWARHPRHYAVDDGCRAMCRLHLTNQQLAPVFAAKQHEAFV